MSNQSQSRFNCLRNIDLFSHANFVCFRGQNEFKTITGGVATIICGGFFIYILITVFFNSIVNKQITTKIKYSDNSQPIQLNSLNFAFFVKIQGTSSENKTSSYKFYVEENKLNKTQKNLTNLKTVPLQNCKKEVVTKLSNDLKDEYEMLEMNSWFCLPANSTQTLRVHGTNIDSVIEYFSIIVQKQQNIQLDEGQLLRIYFANSMIVQGENSVKYYLNDNIQLNLYNNKTLNLDLFLDHERVIRDTSFFSPEFMQYEQKNTTYKIGENYLPKYTKLNNNTVSQINIKKKSGPIKEFHISYRRLEDILSYLGGLMGAFGLIAGIFNLYNEAKFKVKLFQATSKHKDNQNNQKSFNFCTFLKMKLNFCGKFFKKICERNNPRENNEQPAQQEQVSIYSECIENIENIMSIDYILKKIFYLQRIILKNLQKKNIQILGIKFNESESIQSLKDFSLGYSPYDHQSPNESNRKDRSGLQSKQEKTLESSISAFNPNGREQKQEKIDNQQVEVIRQEQNESSGLKSVRPVEIQLQEIQQIISRSPVRKNQSSSKKKRNSQI